MSSKKNSKDSKKSKVRHTAIAPKKTAKVAKNKAASAKPAAVSAPAAKVEPSPVSAQSIVTTSAPTVFSAELEACVVALRNASAESAADAADRLGRSGNPQAVEPLIAVLENVDGYFHPVSRAAAAMALGRLGDNRAIAALSAGVNDFSAEVSGESILALGELKDSSIVSTLTTIVANYSGFYLNVTRHAAIRTLGRLRATDARGTLEVVANSSYEDQALVNAAREAIASL
jgi:HEAT repeat protein